MITLSALTSRELAQLDAVLTALDNTLDMLLDRGACGAKLVWPEQTGVDLMELSEAVAVELEQRESEAA